MATNDIQNKNTFPLVPAGQVPSANTQGNFSPVTVDYFQVNEQLEDKHPNGNLSLYDPKNVDRTLMDSVEQEVIELTSPPIFYYKLKIKGQHIDKLYGESKMRYYEEPRTLFGSYEDTSPEQLLTRYGLDEPQEVDLWFNYSYLLRTLGDQIQIGDIIRTHDGKLFEVLSSLVVHQDLWRALHNSVRCSRVVSEGITLPDLGNISVSPNKTVEITQEPMNAQNEAGELENPSTDTDGFVEL